MIALKIILIYAVVFAICIRIITYANKEDQSCTITIMQLLDYQVTCQITTRYMTAIIQQWMIWHIYTSLVRNEQKS